MVLHNFVHMSLFMIQCLLFLEHLGLALALSVPVFVVVTKIDMCPPNVLQDTMKLLTRILKSPGCRKIPVLVQTEDDVLTSASNFTSERYVHTYIPSSFQFVKIGKIKIKLHVFSLPKVWQEERVSGLIMEG